MTEERDIYMLMLRRMMLIREFEENVKQLARGGELVAWLTATSARKQSLLARAPRCATMTTSPGTTARMATRSPRVGREARHG